MKIIKKIYEENNTNIDKTIVSIADLHLSSETSNKLLTALLTNISDSNPDYITFLGDITNTCQFLEISKVKELYNVFMRELNHISKTIVILGNHDIVYSKDNPIELNLEDKLKYFNGFKDSIFLNNNNYCDGVINFVGYSKLFTDYMKEWSEIDYLIEELNNLSIELDNAQYNVLLTHSPVNVLNENVINEAKILRKIDLILAGHTHNGLIPNIMEKIVSYNKGLNYKFNYVDNVRNRVSNGNCDLIINGGVTKIDTFKPKVFKLLRPIYPAEIDVIKIKCLDKK